MVTDDELRELQRDKTVRLPRLFDEDAAPDAGGDEAEDLSLVTTQMLKQILGHEDPGGSAEEDEAADTDKGFNPYNHS